MLGSVILRECGGEMRGARGTVSLAHAYSIITLSRWHCEYCYLELVCWLWETLSTLCLLTHNLAKISYFTCCAVVRSISWYMSLQHLQRFIAMNHGLQSCLLEQCDYCPDA